MSAKKVCGYDIYREPRDDPVPDRWVLSFETSDEWFYRYVAQQRGDPFEFQHKRRPDMEISEDDVTPHSIKDFFDYNPNFELVDEKLIYHGNYPD